MRANEYRDTRGDIRQVYTNEVFPEYLGGAPTFEQSVAVACEASKRARKCDLIRAIRAMYNAGERFEARDIIRKEMGADIE